MSEIVERLLNIISNLEEEDRETEAVKNKIIYAKEVRKYWVLASLTMIPYIIFAYGLFSYNSGKVIFGLIGVVAIFIMLFHQSRGLRKTNDDYTSSKAYLERAKKIPKRIDIEMNRENIDFLLSELSQAETLRKEKQSLLLSVVGKLTVIIILTPGIAFLTRIVDYAKINERMLQGYFMFLIAIFLLSIGVLMIFYPFLFGEPIFGERYKLWRLAKYLKNLRYYTNCEEENLKHRMRGIKK